MTAGRRASLELQLLELVDVRTYQRLRLELGRGVTILVGPNGVGKTNLLEAAAVLLAGSSPRTSAELRLVRDGASGARIAGRVAIDGDVHERDVRFEPGRGKSLRLDGDVVRSQLAYGERTPSLVFLPERLLVLRGAPARRRGLLDTLAQRLDATVGRELAHYTKVVQQRNVLLRQGRAGRDVTTQLQPWNEQLVVQARLVRAARRALLADLAEPYARLFHQLTGLEGGSFELEPRGPDELAEALEEQLHIDVRRGSTTLGPHLDDILPRQAGRDLRAFGSTGEQRASLLAFTFAAAELVRARTEIEPILLLDEPWSELDADRRSRLSELMLAAGQVLCTTTETPRHLAEHVAAGRVAVHAVQSGSVHPWTATPDSTSSTRAN